MTDADVTRGERLTATAELMFALQDVVHDIHSTRDVYTPAGRARAAAAYDRVYDVARELLPVDELTATEGTPPAGVCPPGKCRHLSCRVLFTLQLLCSAYEEPWFAARPGGWFDASCSCLRIDMRRGVRA